MKHFLIKQSKELQIEKLYEKCGNHSLKLLFGLYRGSYGYLFLSLLFYVIKHSPAWILPVVTAKVVDLAASGNRTEYGKIVVYLLFMVVMTIQNLPTSHLHVHFRSLAIRQVEAELRGALVRKLQHLSILYHKQMSSGRLQSKIMRDVEAVENLSTQLFIQMVSILLSIGIALTVTLTHSRIVFVMFIVTIPLSALAVFLFRKRMQETNQQFREEVENTSGHVMEMMELIPITRAHALEEEEIQKMTGYLEQVAENGYRLDVVQNLFGATGWVIFQVSQLLCLGFTSYLAILKKVTIGDVVLYQSYYTTIITQLTNIMNLVPIMAKGFESLHSIGEVMTSYDEEDYVGKKPVNHIKGEVEFCHVTYQYPESNKPILKNFSLKVKPGETIALVGESGAGKSTVLNMLIGFLKPDSGAVVLDGEDMRNLDLRSFRRHLAVVPQETILFSGTVRENITYGSADVTDKELWKVLKAANLDEVVKNLPHGLDTNLGEHGGCLSGGQRQRISIARSLLRNPDIILWDEATSALDNISERKVQQAFEELSKGKTTFIVAHRLSTIRNVKKIMVMKDGECVEEGDYETLMEKRGVFWEMQNMNSGNLTTYNWR